MTIDASILAAFLTPSHAIIVVLLNMLGLGLKKSKIKNNFIPIILTLVSFLLCLFLTLSEIAIPITFQATMGVVFNIIIQSFCCVAGAVFNNQIAKQVTEMIKPIPTSEESDTVE